MIYGIRETDDKNGHFPYFVLERNRMSKNTQIKIVLLGIAK